MQENVWTPLASWLLATYPDDVLMPVKKGCKAPMFAHSNGQWSWGRFDEFCERRPVANYNVAILLRTLCVVDVDSHDIVVDLEQRFPCLKSCPSETTRKGKHFFFKRSALCDSAEFYDQRSTVVSMVDFKTISATGTSSVIVVGPSENKTWVKTPWSMGDVLQEIPEHLLRAVAIPMHKTASVIFSFPTGEDLVVHKNQHLYKFDLVTSIIGDESDGEVQEAQEVPLYHGSAQLMRELLFFLENRRYSTWLVDVREIERLADYACGTPTVMRSLSSTNPASPTAWITSIDGVSREWAAAYVSGDIIDISTLQPHITYTPLAKDDKWLLESAPHIDLPRGTPMLRADILEYAGQHLPTPVQLILQVFPNVVLAGSSALDIACPHILTAPSDYDFYIFGVDTEEQAIGIIDGIKEIVKPETVTQTGSALTMLVEDEDQGEVTIQIILRRYGSIKHIINSFDVAPCQALFHGGKLWVSASWVFAIKHMAMFVNFHKWTTSSVSRVFKYYSKGFEVYVPGLRRHAFIGAERIDHPEPGVKNLIRIERAHDQQCVYTGRLSAYSAFMRDEMAKMRTEYADMPYKERFEKVYSNWQEIEEPKAKKQRVQAKRISGDTLKVLVKAYNYWGAKHQSGYSEFLGKDRLPHALRSLVNTGMQWLGLRPVKGIEPCQLTVPAASGEPFHLSPPNFAGLYDFNKV